MIVIDHAPRIRFISTNIIIIISSSSSSSSIGGRMRLTFSIQLRAIRHRHEAGLVKSGKRQTPSLPSYLYR